MSVATITENELSRWLKNDAQLWIVFNFTIHSSLKQILRAYETCSEVWELVKLLYTNDTDRPKKDKQGWTVYERRNKRAG